MAGSRETRVFFSPSPSSRHPSFVSPRPSGQEATRCLVSRHDHPRSLSARRGLSRATTTEPRCNEGRERRAPIEMPELGDVGDPRFPHPSSLPSRRCPIRAATTSTNPTVRDNHLSRGGGGGGNAIERISAGRGASSYTDTADRNPPSGRSKTGAVEHRRASEESAAIRRPIQRNLAASAIAIVIIVAIVMTLNAPPLAATKVIVICRGH
jgi:hypothetical protein